MNRTEEENIAALINGLIGVAEGGSVVAILGAVTFSVVKLIKRNGCTCKIKSCKGAELVVMDCEEGSAEPRHSTVIERVSKA